MIRSAAFILALVVAGPTVDRSGESAKPVAVPRAPAMIGEDRPVFLGSMTVEATALPEEGANTDGPKH